MKILKRMFFGALMTFSLLLVISGIYGIVQEHSASKANSSNTPQTPTNASSNQTDSSSDGSDTNVGLKFFWTDGQQTHTYYLNPMSKQPDEYMQMIVQPFNSAIERAAQDVLGPNASNSQEQLLVVTVDLKSVGVIEKTVPYTFCSYYGSDSSLEKTLEFGLYLDQEEAKGFYTSKEWESLNMPNFASVSPLAVGVGNLLLVYSPGQQLVGAYNAQNNALVYTGNFTSIPAIASALSQNTAVEALAFGMGQ